MGYFSDREGKDTDKVTLKQLYRVLDKRDEENKTFAGKLKEMFGLYSFWDVLNVATYGLVAYAAAKFTGLI